MIKAAYVLPDVPHAVLSASGAARWLNCAWSASPASPEPPPQVPKRYAEEGTVAHHIGSDVLAGNSALLDHLGKVYKSGQFTFEVDHEMLNAVQVYVETCRVLYARLAAGYGAAKVHQSVEHTLTPALSALHPDFGGIADYDLWAEGHDTLYVVEYKHGQGILVAAEGNKQLKYYVLGALLSMPDLGASIRRVIVCVVQPRCEADEVVRYWEFDAIDLLEYEVDLKAGAEEVYSANPRLSAGPWCKSSFCPHRINCPAVKEAQDLVVAGDFDDLDLVKPDTLAGMAARFSPEKVAAGLELVPLLEARIKALRELGYYYLASGEEVPGHKLVPKRAVRKWREQAAADAEFANEPTCWTDPKLKSVAQVEKVVGKEAFKAKADLVDKVSSGFKMVPATAPGEAVKELASPDEFESFE